MDQPRFPVVAPLYEGTFSVGLDKKFIRIPKDGKPRKGALKLAINPFLIRTGNRNILFDAGLGDFGEDTSTDVIKENLLKFDLSEHDITDVFMSHLHFDHLGGLAGRSNGYLSLTFPDAKIWISRNEWQKLLSLEGAPDDETRLDFIYFLDAKADIRFLENEGQPYSDIRTKEIGGHTEFSQVLFFVEGDRKYMMAGDVIGKMNSVKQKFTAKFDFDPQKSMKCREELKRLAYDETYIIMAYHESETPLFRLTGSEDPTGYQTERIVNPLYQQE